MKKFIPCVCNVLCAKSLKSCPTLGDLWITAHQAPLSLGLSRLCIPPGVCPCLYRCMSLHNTTQHITQIISILVYQFILCSLVTNDISCCQSVQLLSHVQLFVTPWKAACQASLSITNSWSFLKLMSIKSVMPSNLLILCHPLIHLPSIFPSIRVFSNESVLCIRWPKYWSFSFSISHSNGYSGLISFRIDWFYLLAVQGTLKSLLQYHISKASILQCSAFFMVQLSHPYMTTGKTIPLTSKGNVSTFKYAVYVDHSFSSKERLLISWLKSPSAGILEPKKLKSVTVSIVSPYICQEVMGPYAMILVFWMLSFNPSFSTLLFYFWCRVRLFIWLFSYFFR